MRKEKGGHAWLVPIRAALLRAKGPRSAAAKGNEAEGGAKRVTQLDAPKTVNFGGEPHRVTLFAALLSMLMIVRLVVATGGRCTWGRCTASRTGDSALLVHGFSFGKL